MHSSWLLWWWDDSHIWTIKEEGINNKIKVMKHNAYGFRNERYFKLWLYALHDCRVTRNVGWARKKHAKVCFFDISEFNNVKSSFEVILCRPNEGVFKIKELILLRLCPYRKPRWAEVGQTYIHKGVTVRFGFDAVRIWQFEQSCQEQSNGNASWGVLYTAPIGFERFYRPLSRVFPIYVHRRGAFGVARFDNLGDARAFTAWNEWQDWLHVFMYIYQPFIKHANMVAVGKKEE